MKLQPQMAAEGIDIYNSASIDTLNEGMAAVQLLTTPAEMIRTIRARDVHAPAMFKVMEFLPGTS